MKELYVLEVQYVYVDRQQKAAESKIHPGRLYSKHSDSGFQLDWTF
jgi:hypothetical protein